MLGWVFCWMRAMSVAAVAFRRGLWGEVEGLWGSEAGQQSYHPHPRLPPPSLLSPSTSLFTLALHLPLQPRPPLPSLPSPSTSLFTLNWRSRLVSFSVLDASRLLPFFLFSPPAGVAEPTGNSHLGWLFMRTMPAVPR